MTDPELSIVAFSIVFLIIGAAGTYLRRTTPPDQSPPIKLEVLGWASGGTMLAYTGIIAALEYYGPQTPQSLSAVFVFAVMLYGSTAVITVMLLKHLHRISDSGSSGGGSSPDAKPN
jgi:hypothetical protein